MTALILRNSYRALLPLALATLAASSLLSTGCGKRGGEGEGPTKLKVAFLGLTCEAPIFVAYEKGFYEEEGLDVELVRTDWDGLREGLGAGSFDANHTLIMYLLKPIEQGLDVKMTGGIHTGCLRVQAGKKGEVKTVKDLKGKRIGVPTHIGSPPYLFATRVLGANGIDPSVDGGEVEWKAIQPELLGQALDNGSVDAVATSDPIGTILLGKGKVVTLADQAIDEPYKDEYCCAAVVSGNLLRRDPKAAAAVTRALLKGAKWVEANPGAAARLSVEKKYLASDPKINEQAISKLRYIPGVARCKTSIDQAALEMKKTGLLKPTTDPVALSKRAWADLDGVTDEWVKGVKVERVAGGKVPRILTPAEFAALFEGKCICCNRCCIH
jgi:NitT/TauT family transport system substrate-binding protein